MTTITTRVTEIEPALHAVVLASGGWTTKFAAPADIAAELAARVDAGEPAEAAITPTAAAHVLYHYGATGGMEPGAFTRHLIEAIVRADRENWCRLLVTYPAYAQAAHLAANTADGVRRLQDIAKQLLVTAEETP